MGGKRPIVGIIGNSPPVELIVAAGAEPVLVRPDPHGPTDAADPYLDWYIDPGVRNVLDSAVRGNLEHIDLLVVDGADDRLYHYMREVVRMGEGSKIPPLYLYDLMQAGSVADRPYNVTQLRALADRLESLTGVHPGEQALSKAIASSNKARGLQRQLMEARQGAKPRLSGAEAARIMRQTRGRDPAETVDELTRALAAVPAEGLPGARLLLIPSTELHDDAVHKLFEDAGAVVTVEDDISGARGAWPDIASNDEALGAIVDRLYVDLAGPRVAPAENRFAWTFNQMAAPYVEGIVFYIPPSDRDFGWNYPKLRAVANELGKPWLLIREDAYDAKGLAALMAKAAEFVSSIRQGAAA